MYPGNTKLPTASQIQSDEASAKWLERKIFFDYTSFDMNSGTEGSWELQRKEQEFLYPEIHALIEEARDMDNDPEQYVIKETKPNN